MLIRNHTATKRKLFLPQETQTEDPKDPKFVKPEDRAYLLVRRWTFAEKRAYLDAQARRVVAESDFSHMVNVFAEPDLVLAVGNLSILEIDDDGNEKVKPFKLEKNAEGIIPPEVWDQLPLSVLTAFFNEFLLFNAATIERTKKSEPQRTSSRGGNPTAAEHVASPAKRATDTAPDGGA